AGLKAGYMSNTWPLMFGSWIPDGLLSYIQPWWKNLLETPATVYYVHRWFAFVVLAVSAWLYYLAKSNGFPDEFKKGALVMLALVAVQITLGVTVVWFSIQIVLALVHQGTAIALFGTTVFLLHRLARA
ncbi:MAG: heme A synthase, partial [Chloroflexi bacterium]|nr:heme A synthase [Chloroflexota bacterium]